MERCAHDAGVQAILPDAVLLAVATAQPDSSDNLIGCIWDNLSKLDSSKDSEDIMTKDVESRLQQHAEQVSHSVMNCQCKQLPFDLWRFYTFLTTYELC